MMRALFISGLLAASGFSGAPALAQDNSAEVAEQPRLQRLPRQALRLETEESEADSNETILRNPAILQQRAESQPARGREPAGSYTAECARIRDIFISPYVIRIQCFDADQYGNRTYPFEPGGFDRADPASEQSLWMTEQLLDAARWVRSDPSARLSLRVHESTAYEPRIQTFTITFAD